ncbi:MAG: hypothetical protein ACK48H_13880 [Microcystis sp.]|uniref:hypothetical protein n=1 Tax=Microcystis sp. TaxID=1127 RepID=UPI00391D0C96
MSFQFTDYCLLDGYAVPLATLKKASPHTLHPTPPPAPPMSGGLGGSHPTPHTPHPSPFSTIITRNQKYLVGFISYFVLFVKKTFFLQ